MIKIIEGLKPWEVMKRADEGEPVVYKNTANEWKRAEFPNWGWHCCEYAIIDTSEPVVDWDKFDWDFFNQYGGLQVIYRTYRNFIHDATHSHLAESNLTPSPLYYWHGRGCPVPSNLEVECEFIDSFYSGINGLSNKRSSKVFRASEVPWDEVSLVGFKITGNVL